MDEKEVYVGVFEMLSYTDVLRHIAEQHGEEGTKIVQSSEDMPLLWHEYQHLSTEFGHVHANNHKEAIERVGKVIETISSDDSKLEEFSTLLESKSSEVKEYLDELNNK